MGKSCVIFDIDGTLADVAHRLHFITEQSPKDWDGFFSACSSDLPIQPVVNLLTCVSARYDIVIVTGRSTECRQQTTKWLQEHVPALRGGFPLYMRAEDDRRADHVVKAELLEQMRADGWEPWCAFEDRRRVVDMWREKGLLCCQVAPGDF